MAINIDMYVTLTRTHGEKEGEARKHYFATPSPFTARNYHDRTLEIAEVSQEEWIAWHQDQLQGKTTELPADFADPLKAGSITLTEPLVEGGLAMVMGCHNSRGVVLHFREGQLSLEKEVELPNPEIDVELSPGEY